MAAVLDRMQKEKHARVAASQWLDTASSRDRHWIVKQLYYTRHKRHPEISAAIIDLIQLRNGNVQLQKKFTMLLCLTLARTHDPKYLKHIVCLKGLNTDMESTIDSNLLFEFSPGGTRSSCIRDTMGAIGQASKGNTKQTGSSLGGFASISGEAWFEDFVEMAGRYATQYDEKLCERMWERYLSQEYAEMFDLSQEDWVYTENLLDWT